ncbi:MAG: hypothetical protein Q7S61_04790 [bacterium]|nr:hypothetical protein [bacterium]
MEKDILHVIHYFSLFSYPPTFEDIHMFLSRRTTTHALILKLDQLVKKRKIIRKRLKIGQLFTFNSQFSTDIYTLPQYSIFLKSVHKKMLLSQSKLHKVRLYLRLLSFVPQIKLVGISGSLAMMNAQKDDDIDLFIISSIGKMWTARFIATCLALGMGMKRKRGVLYARDKVCLNLVFDVSDLTIPKSKRSEYTAHEVLQMKPIINKSSVYDKFIWDNRWVVRFFPNQKGRIETYARSVKKKYPFKESVMTHRSKLIMMDVIEKVLRKAQLYFIHRHTTTERISETQLWFHPDDFQKKLSVK